MTVSGLNRASSPIQQLLTHPNWEGKKEEQLEKGSYIIMKRADSNFCILWLNQQEEKVSVPFKISDKEFSFKNGQAHHFHHLNELISEIFKHYK